MLSTPANYLGRFSTREGALASRCMLLVVLTMSTLLCGTVQTSHASTYAPRIYVADNRFNPGEVHYLKRTQGSGCEPFRLHERAPESHYLNRNPIHRIGSFAMGPRDELYICSGLDMCIYRVDGRRERLVHVHTPARRGQAIRDLAISKDGRTLYYSIMRTRQGHGDTLDNGMIYGVSTNDLQRQRPTANKPWDHYRVYQDEVGYSWFGMFDVSSDGELYLATVADYSNVYRVQGGRPRIVFSSSRSMEGFTVEGRTLYFTDGKTSVYRAINFENVGRILQLPGMFTFRDVQVTFGPQRR